MPRNPFRVWTLTRRWPCEHDGQPTTVTFGGEDQATIHGVARKGIIIIAVTEERMNWKKSAHWGVLLTYRRWEWSHLGPRRSRRNDGGAGEGSSCS